MNIAILDDYQDVVQSLDCFGLLAGHNVTVFTQTLPESVLIHKLADMDALVLIRERTQITASLLNALPKLQVISQTGKVSHHIHPELCARFGVQVLEGVGSPVAPAELCWALIMSASRHIPAYSSNLLQHRWQDSNQLGLGRSLNGLTLGIWGYGKIGQRIARYANAFEMQVLVWGSEASRQRASEDGFVAAESKAAFFSQADVLSLHLRLNEVTKGCVTADDLRQMKPDSLFVNTSRAELLESNALYQELSACPSKRAAVDVFEHEPASTQNEPLLSLPNVVATPHLGYVERNSCELYFRTAFENLLTYIAGR